jgi:hypothetical protein
MRARHYDPATGRFLQPDPLGLDADQLYAYARSNPYRFWDPFGLEPGLRTGGVQSIRAWSPAEPRRASASSPPNFDFLEPGEWHYSRNAIDIELPAGQQADEALRLVRGDFRRFRSFTHGNVAEVDVEGDIAYFNLTGWEGMASDTVAGNDDWVAVRVSQHPDVQAAVTLGRHQLEGIRIWYAAQRGPTTITVVTEAFERPRGWTNAVGFKVAGAHDQKAIWDVYFKNIDMKYFGGRGKPQDFISVPVRESINPLIGYVAP